MQFGDNRDPASSRVAGFAIALLFMNASINKPHW
jgi:hypothetical protein